MKHEDDIFLSQKHKYEEGGAYHWPSLLYFLSGARERYNLTAQKIIESKLDEDAVIVDFGGGDGALTYSLNMLGLTNLSRIVNLDLDPLALGLAQEKNNEYGYDSLQVQSSTTLPLSNESVSTVVALEVMEHIKDDDKLLKELVRVLKLDGQLILSTPSHNFPTTDAHFRHYDISQLINKVKSNNLIVTEIYGQTRIPDHDLKKKVKVASKRMIAYLLGKETLSTECIYDHSSDKKMINPIKYKHDGYLLVCKKY